MKWLFIVGINNSGTSVINHILADHPNIDHLTLEGHAAKHMVGPWNYKTETDNIKLGRIWSERPEPLRELNVNVEQVRKEWLEMRVTTGGEYTMEKSPPNAIRTPWLQRNFPPAYFIVITRDPVAVAEGTHRKRPVITVKRAARHWLRTHEILYEDMKGLNRKHLIKYEDLCAAPRRTLRGIEDFLGVPYHDYGGVLSGKIDLGYKRMRVSELKNWNPWSYEQLSTNQVAMVKKVTEKMRKRFGY